MGQKHSESQISAALDLDVSLARVLAHLLDEKVVKAEAVEARNTLRKGSGRVYLGRLRTFLKEQRDIDLQTKKNVGYFLTPDDRRTLITEIEHFIS